MARLIYSTIGSLDGYVADEHGDFDWAAPDEHVHGFVNDLERPIGTYLYGRRMYEVMSSWGNEDSFADEEPVTRDYAQVWQSADKIVYSTTLSTTSTAKTRIERTFEPEAIRQLKASATQDLSVGGPDLAADALRAGLVDELHQFLVPVVVGAGTACFPADLRLRLELLREHRFGNGTVHLHYRIA